VAFEQCRIHSGGGDGIGGACSGGAGYDPCTIGAGGAGYMATL